MGKVKTSVYIDEELWREFRQLAVREGSEVSKLLEEAIRNYIIQELIDVDDSDIPIWFEPVEVGGESVSKMVREMRDEREKGLLGQ
ncbi:ribbon-helix-helix protein, CopG family [Thermococcus sp.]|uniref:ribbon-helix-helix protein, CopG family n=1 Tax=Thermococcus sp. TaxID=35749 RepID=UPI002616AC89|nr:ribbon-helix-helix protein, CopG family [Thermococcus sp.]